jgi:AbrB family looped-hinge helix DNA binding protein
MSAATITSKGQITIPKDIRALLDLHCGDRINFIVDDSGEVRFVPLVQDVGTLKGIVARPDKAVSIEDMKATVRARVSES